MPKSITFNQAELAPMVKGASNSTGNFLVAEFAKVITRAIRETV